MLLARMQPERIDMTRRVEPHDLPEWMDQPCSYQEFHACLSDLAQVNRLTLASRPTSVAAICCAASRAGRIGEV